MSNEVLAAVITVITALIAAGTTLFTVVLQRTMKAAIGTQNGLGSVMTQLERIDAYITGEYARQAKIDQEAIVNIVVNTVLERIAQEKEGTP